MRRAYVEWVEEQVEAYKDSIPRSQLLTLADDVIRQLRMDDAGQYQLTELLLCEAVDKRIVRMLKLPSYRAWCAMQRAAPPPPEPPAPVEVVPFRPAPEEAVCVA